MGAIRKRRARAAKRGKTQLIELGIALCACIVITILAFEIRWMIEWIWRTPLILFPITVVLARRGTLGDLGLTGRNAARNIDLGILAGVLLAAAFLLFIRAGFWSPDVPLELSWGTFFYGACTIILSVVSIEIFYRGYLQPRFEAVAGLIPGLIATSVLSGFDFWEYKVFNPFSIAIAALVFGFLFQRTRTLVAPITAHCMFIFLVFAAHVF